MVTLSSLAHAGVIEVRPTTLAITPSQRVAILSLVNPEARAAIYQARIFRWRQNGDQQILEPTDDMIASPPMVSLAANGSQIVRVGLRDPTLPDHEVTYRLILEEVPTSGLPDAQGLNIALKLSFPIFVRPQSTPPPDRLAASLRLSGNRARVTIRNNGSYAARISRAALAVASGDSVAVEKLTYILPGAWAAYDFSLAAVPAALRSADLTLRTDAGDVALNAPVEAEATPDAPLPVAP